jgi:pimeloyl-ACP methyl ester carboxylesterase
MSPGSIDTTGTVPYFPVRLINQHVKYSWRRMRSLLPLLIMLGASGGAAAQNVGHYADVNGLRMYYEVHGEGFPLALIHGGGSTIGTTFGAILPALAKSHRVIAVELQAHGHTADIARPLSFEQDADDVAALLRQLRIPKADIFGFSNGASTTLQIAIRHPELVRRIVVASTMYRKDGAYQWLWDSFGHIDYDEMPKQLADAYLRINPDTAAFHTMIDRDVARMRSFTDISEEEIASIQAPALIIAGDHDVVRPEHAVEMYRAMQHATLVILPGGHGEYMGEIMTLKPGQRDYPVLAIIEEFLGDPSAPAAR